MSTTEPDAPLPAEARGDRYTVVARRYRPQGFAELVGQENVGRALAGAILSNRVGHAYLFTGARGVGKTSTARILAKALNCVEGPTPTPCNRCDICQSISRGDDVDVLEIDGASNRGIDEIRELRQNVNVRPSRARYKIYIIDEVHMLTAPAFNALLKTLEEPPEHVKFIFCTTEPEKIPITILSRCQRFDFAGIDAPSIARRLHEIAAHEGVEITDEALELLARRAAGSMRDSQSLLEQLLAFGGQQISAADVHRMLGTAPATRVGALVEHLITGNAAAALDELAQALGEGTDVGQLLVQLLGYFRDAMLAAVGCTSERFLYAARDEADQVSEAANRLGIESILAVMQILDSTLARLRWTTQGRVLAELALVRIATLERLDDLALLVDWLKQGMPDGELAPARPASGGAPAQAVDSRTTSPAEPLAKKKWLSPEPIAAAQAPPVSRPVAPASPAAAPPVASQVSSAPPVAGDASPLGGDEVQAIWERALGNVSTLVADFGRKYDSVANLAPGTLVVYFRAQYSYHKSMCERPEYLAKLQEAVREAAGQPLQLRFVLREGDPGEASTPARQSPAAPARDRQREAVKHPMVERALELFDARISRVDEPRR